MRIPRKHELPLFIERAENHRYGLKRRFSAQRRLERLRFLVMSRPSAVRRPFELRV